MKKTFFSIILGLIILQSVYSFMATTMNDNNLIIILFILFLLPIIIGIILGIIIGKLINKNFPKIGKNIGILITILGMILTLILNDFNKIRICIPVILMGIIILIFSFKNKKPAPNKR